MYLQYTNIAFIGNNIDTTNTDKYNCLKKLYQIELKAYH